MNEEGALDTHKEQRKKSQLLGQGQSGVLVAWPPRAGPGPG